MYPSSPSPVNPFAELCFRFFYLALGPARGSF